MKCLDILNCFIQTKEIPKSWNVGILLPLYRKRIHKRMFEVVSRKRLHENRRKHRLRRCSSIQDLIFTIEQIRKKLLSIWKKKCLSRFTKSLRQYKENMENLRKREIEEDDDQNSSESI